jgi:hypothetical protein
MFKKGRHYTRPPQVGQDPLLPEARSQVKSILQTYRHSTRAALSRPRPALSHRYVKDILKPRTKFREGRVLRVRSLSWPARGGGV